jgi:hypothetical protein
MEWQPIETAPLMKLLILFCVTERDAAGTVKNWKMGCGTKDYAGAWGWNGYPVKPWDHQPTHWMPLPDPPNTD